MKDYKLPQINTILIHADEPTGSKSVSTGKNRAPADHNESVLHTRWKSRSLYAIASIVIAVALSACSSSTGTHPSQQGTRTATGTTPPSTGSSSTGSSAGSSASGSGQAPISNGSQIYGYTSANTRLDFKVIRIARGTLSQVGQETAKWQSLLGNVEPIKNLIPSGYVYLVIDFVQTSFSGRSALLPNPNVSTFPVVLLASPSLMHVGSTGQTSLGCAASGPLGIGVGAFSENMTGRTCVEENFFTTSNNNTAPGISGGISEHIVVAWAVPSTLPNSALHLGWDTSTNPNQINARWSQSVPLIGRSLTL